MQVTSFRFTPNFFRSRSLLRRSKLRRSKLRRSKLRRSSLRRSGSLSRNGSELNEGGGGGVGFSCHRKQSDLDIWSRFVCSVRNLVTQLLDLDANVGV